MTSWGNGTHTHTEHGKQVMGSAKIDQTCRIRDCHKFIKDEKNHESSCT